MPAPRHHAEDQRADSCSISRSAATPSEPPTPVEAEAGAMPADDGLGFHDEENLRPAAPDAAQCGPKQQVKGVHLWARPFPLEDGDLLPRSEDRQCEIATATEANSDARRAETVGCQHTRSRILPVALDRAEIETRLRAGDGFCLRE